MSHSEEDVTKSTAPAKDGNQTVAGDLVSRSTPRRSFVLGAGGIWRLSQRIPSLTSRRAEGGNIVLDVGTDSQRRTGPGIDTAALVAIRLDMLRFARLQLRNPETAEDLVQEAIEAALKHSTTFSGQSSLKTWVFAILRNRIIDHLRRSSRTVSLASVVGDGEDWEDRLDSLFNEQGGWRDGARPQAWPDPEAAMQSRQFWAVFEAWLDHLPERTGRVFMMREFLGFESDEICTALGLTTGNCHVILHRARLRLRGCMEAGWGRPAEASC